MRTVGTRLTAEVAGYTNPVKQAKRETRGLIDELQDAARKGDLTAKAIGTVGPTSKASLGLSTAAAAKLENQIGETTREVQRLDAAFRETGDLAIFRDLEKQMRKLKKQLGVRGQFADFGDGAAEGFSARFVGRLGPLLASAPISPPLLIAAAGAAPLVAGVISAAVVGGIAAGVTGGGVALAIAGDAKLKAAAEGLGQTFKSTMVAASASFREPTLKAIGDVDRGIRALEPILEETFEAGARHLPKLTSGLLGAAREMAHSVNIAAGSADPIIDVLSGKLPQLTDEIGDQLDMISGGSEDAAAALSSLLTAVEMLSMTIGPTVRGLTEAFGFLDQANAVTGVFGLADKLGWLEEEAEGAVDPVEDVGTAITRAGTAASRSAEEVDALNKVLADAPGEALAAEEALLRMDESYLSLTETIKENGKQTDTNSKKYIENKGRLLDYAGSVQTAAERVREQTGSQDAANAVLDEGRRNFLASANAAGVNAREAKKLADRLFGIPGKRQTDIRVNKQAAEAALREFNAKAAAATRARELRIRVRYTSPSQSGALGAVGQLGMRHGGIVEHAQHGLLREAKIATPMGPARYAWAEQATGGEAFIPKYGDRNRSLAIADRAAGWHGGMVVPRGAGGGGGAVRVVFDFHGADAELGRALRKMVRVEGRGDVQVAFGQH